MTTATVSDHYDRHLGPLYSWMVGGVESAIERGAAELEALGATPSASGVAVDLGAGFGMHAIPLARRGFRVLAVDACAALLGELRSHGAGLPVDTVLADLRAFPRYLTERPELVLCMGDTLGHLPDRAAVEELIGLVAAALDPGGRFVLTLRDYSTALTGARRFIPVRSDRDRIFTCFLEYFETHLEVHDVLHERDGSAWRMSVSAYRKLRLSPEWVASSLRDHGFSVEQKVGPSGMLRFIATRA